MINKILILMIINIYVYANVTINASKTFIENENYYFDIEASGSKVNFPSIKKIDNIVVYKIGESSSYSNVNGKITHKIKKKYSLKTNRSFKIPSFEVLIDGVTYATNAIDVRQQKNTKTKSENFDLNLSLENTDLYVGEQTVLTMIIKYKEGLQIQSMSLAKPEFKNFWFKDLKNIQPYKQNGFIIQELKYILFAQKEGILNIKPLRVDVVYVKSNRYVSLNLYSNKISVNVKPLPKNTILIGDFNIEASVDKVKIKAGESVAYNIKIKGFGNLDDFSGVKLSIDDVTIYENKADTHNQISNNKNYGMYKKSFSILSNSSFRIPSVSLQYFDKKTNKVVIKKTKIFDILVEKEIQENNTLVTNENIKQDSKKEYIEKIIITKTSNVERLIYFILGLITAILSIGLYYYVITRSARRRESLSIVDKVKKSSTKIELIKYLLPYLNKNDDLDMIIFDLEKDTEIDIKLIRKKIIKILKELK